MLLRDKLSLVELMSSTRNAEEFSSDGKDEVGEDSAQINNSSSIESVHSVIDQHQHGQLISRHQKALDVQQTFSKQVENQQQQVRHYDSMIANDASAFHQNMLLGTLNLKHPPDDLKESPRPEKKLRTEHYSEEGEQDCWTLSSLHQSNAMSQAWGPNEDFEPTPLSDVYTSSPGPDTKFSGSNPHQWERNTSLPTNNHANHYGPTNYGAGSSIAFPENRHPLLSPQSNVHGFLDSLTTQEYSLSPDPIISPRAATTLGMEDPPIGDLQADPFVQPYAPPSAINRSYLTQQQYQQEYSPDWIDILMPLPNEHQHQASQDFMMSHLPGNQNQAAHGALHMHQQSSSQNQAAYGTLSGAVPGLSPNTGINFHAVRATAQGFEADFGYSFIEDATSKVTSRDNSIRLSSSRSSPRPSQRMGPTALPPIEEGNIEHFANRRMFPLGIDEDPNWLSEFHCFVRQEMVEVCRASRDQCKERNNLINFEQVGIRCRFCAHKSCNDRSGRSSAYPSSLRQIYQSFTMMLRDHFPNCDCIPNDVSRKFTALKARPSQGASDSRRFWIYSSMKIGMIDSKDGRIMISEETILAGRQFQPYGNNPGEPWLDEESQSISLVSPSDTTLVDQFILKVFDQVQVVGLKAAERTGSRRHLRLGLPGISCRACCQERRLGMCRVFPSRRRLLPSRFHDMYDHLKRCSLVPQGTKDLLDQLKQGCSVESMTDKGKTKEFYDHVWMRLMQQQPSPTLNGTGDVQPPLETARQQAMGGWKMN